MQIKTTMSHHFTPIRMAITKIEKENVLSRMWRSWKVCTLLVGIKMVQVLWKRVKRFLKKVNTELMYDPAIPFLGI